MKRLVIFTCTILACSIANAQTETINWYVDNENYATTTCEIGGDIDLPITPHKKGYTFQGWKPEIQFIEYIISDGAHAINTGINNIFYPIIETKFQMLGVGDIDWFGSNITNWNFANNGNIPYIRYGQSGSSPVSFSSGYSAKDLNFSSEPHTLRYGFYGDYYNIPIFVDDVLIATLSVSSFSNSSSNILISGCRGAAYAKWYSFKIWNYDNTLLFDGRPAIDKYGRAGIYDGVTGNFYIGIGFTAGPITNE